MIVVIGSPIGRRDGERIEAAGAAAALARVAAAAGAEVQLVGRVGEDDLGDGVVLALARAGIGHVAVLRDAGRATAEVLASDEDALDDVTDEAPAPLGLTLDAADLELALRYLPDYRVVVVADALDESALATAIGAARWAGAQLIVLVEPGARPTGLPAEATVLEAPADDPDGAFAAVVGAYAAALDRGVGPAEAFASASGAAGATPVVD